MRVRFPFYPFRQGIFKFHHSPIFQITNYFTSGRGGHVYPCDYFVFHHHCLLSFTNVVKVERQVESLFSNLSKTHPVLSKDSEAKSNTKQKIIVPTTPRWLFSFQECLL